MENYYILQLRGILLALTGMAGLALAGQVFGRRLNASEKRRLGDDWAQKSTVYRLPFRWETLLFLGFILGGGYMLAVTHFEVCRFLAYWLPDLPQAARMMFACR
jgi:hypothetical protein